MKMNKLGKSVGTALVMSAMLVALFGCKQEGPAERAGKNVDQAAQKVGQQVEKVGNSIQDAAKGNNK